MPTHQENFRSPLVDGFESSHSQGCPHSDIERFKVLQDTFNKAIEKMGPLYIGLLAVPHDVKVSAKILRFHALQRAVQVMRNVARTTPEFRQGVTEKNYLDIVRFGSYNYTIDSNWKRDQERLADQFFAKYAAEIEILEEYFDISSHKILDESRRDYTRVGVGEKPCTFGWYAFQMKPKKAIPADKKIGVELMQENLEYAWQKIGDGFTSINKKMPPVPKPAKAKERVVPPVEDTPVEVPAVKPKPNTPVIVDTKRQPIRVNA
jgi:hypothetical protein